MVITEVKQKLDGNRYDAGFGLRKDWKKHNKGGGWVHIDAKVHKDALIHDGCIVRAGVINSASVKIMGTCVIYGGRITGHAELVGGGREEGHQIVVEHEAVIKDKTIIRGNIAIMGNAVISGEARVYGSAYIRGSAQIKGKVFLQLFGGNIDEHAVIKDECSINANFSAFGDSVVGGNVHICTSESIIIHYNTKLLGKFKLSHGMTIQGGTWKKAPVVFMGSSFRVYESKPGWAQVGCQNHPVDWWLTSPTAKKLAKEHAFTPAQIEEYKDIFKFIKKHGSPFVPLERYRSEVQSFYPYPLYQ